MIEKNYLESVKAQFLKLKNLAEEAIAQVSEEKLDWQYNAESNSLVSLVKHLSGNMLSRFTDFLNSDGEKKWRDRDAEFDPEHMSRELLMQRWNQGWSCLFEALDPLEPKDLLTNVLIRKESLTVMEAINRQLIHYASHAGQIVFLCKMICPEPWKTLSIARNASRDFNKSMGL